jgi:type II secretory pathway pseudopilin PulG
MIASSRRGFTIVEVIVATMVLAFGILAGVALLGTGFRWQGQAELTTQLTVAAESKIEDLKAVQPGPAGALQITVVARPAFPSVARRIRLSTQLVHR